MEKSSTVVALVDDDEGVRVGLSLLLRAMGYRVQAGETASETIAACRTTGWVPSVAIVDYQLAGGSLGTQAISDMRAAFGLDLSVLLLSGENLVSLHQAAADLGVKVIRKPADAAAILAAIKAC